MPLQQQQSVNQHLFKRLIELFLSVVLRAVILRQIVESTISWANSEQLNYFMRSFFFFFKYDGGFEYEVSFVGTGI